MKILLAVDGSSYTKRMLAWLTTHEEWLSAPRIHRVDRGARDSAHAASMFTAEQPSQYYDDTAEGIFKPIRKFTAKHDLATNFVSKVGHAPESLPRWPTRASTT